MHAQFNPFTEAYYFYICFSLIFSLAIQIWSLMLARTFGFMTTKQSFNQKILLSTLLSVQKISFDILSLSNLTNPTTIHLYNKKKFTITLCISLLISMQLISIILMNGLTVCGVLSTGQVSWQSCHEKLYLGSLRSRAAAHLYRNQNILQASLQDCYCKQQNYSSKPMLSS